MNNKSKGFNLAWVLSIVVITSIVSALTTGVIVYNNNKITNKVSYADLSNDKELNEFLEVYANITSEYYEDVNKKELLEKAIAAMMNYLGDDYTSFLDDNETNDLMQKLAGEYTGIGVSINNSDKSISKVFKDTPASKAGILEGDIIIGLNNEDLSVKNANEVVDLIKKTTGTFTLKLKRGENVINVDLKNEKIISPSITYKMIDETKVGYIYIEAFSKTLATQVKNALDELENAGMESLIIDLRDDTGGYLDAATEVASLYLEKGKRIYSLNYKGEITNYDDKTSDKKDYEIVILINGNTASASEILAAALKESYGASIVGEKSYGKGKVQQTLDLSGGSMVKYTSAYWLTPNGTCIDKVGIAPDYPVSNELITDENNKVIEQIDRQLEKAIELLK